MILVTGITGKSGIWFFKRLAQEKSPLWNEKFRIVIRNKSKGDLVCNDNLSIEKVFGDLNYDEQKLEYFTETVRGFRGKGKWSRSELIAVFNRMIPEFNHKETGKFLDGKM
ncbi:MAG: hypothetical protein LBQ22_00690 [Bacteroidales bacterium]|jgi:hypothetical protein|nr:hypothetical protein [Bacteroidales bacterium]